MFHSELENLLQQAMGLDTASIGSSAVVRAVRGRMSVCGLTEVEVYLERVRTSKNELQALIEAVIVPETWFFRDGDALAELARVAQEEWVPANPGGTLRLLSVPCSSGEEPYSMAMALCDVGLSPKRCRIDAVDISAQGINTALRAMYGKNSFRGADLKFRDRYFETTALGWRLSDAVRQPVQFQQGNLLADDFLPGAEIYDIIFCRNLLIYFDRNAQDRAVEVLGRLLTPKGVLFVGPSESGLLLSHGFISSKVPLAFAFRRGGSKAALRAPTLPALKPPSAAAKSLVPNAATRDAAPRATRVAEPPATHEDTLAGAVRLADQGRMADAAKACDEHLRKHGPSVPAFFLLGLIRAATGNLTEARDYYRKALYLDRNHHDSLIHLGLLLEKEGDAAGARVIHERLQRLVTRRTA
jgi:chemotaxis protein methyltransferase WspC